MSSPRFLEAFFLLGFVAVTAARAERFVMDDVYGRNLVEFASRATLETIVGITNQVGGYIEVNPDNILDSPDCYVEVDLRSLKTGIEARDRKMREEFLEVDSFPKATFKLERIIKSGRTRLVDQKEFELLCSGVLFLHGFEKEVEASLRLMYVRESEVTRVRQPGDLLHLVARFDLLLSDFGIVIPHAAFLKVNERQSITVDVFAFTGPEN
jgi:polyisoprenoid-binding protein YceI